MNSLGCDDAIGLYPALPAHVVIVHGPSAAGVYDLLNGEFHRVTLAAAMLLESCMGVTPLEQWSTAERALIEEAQIRGLVDFRSSPVAVSRTQLQDVIKPLRAPKFAWVELTSKCNQECLHCFLGDQLNATPHVPVERLFRYADELSALGVNQDVLSGGEPTLHPKFREILAHFGRHNFRLTLLTNASTKWFETFVEDLALWQVTVKVPLLGWASTHDEMAGLPGGFDRTMSALTKLQAAGVRTQLGTTVTAVNEPDVERIRQYAQMSGMPLEFSPVFLVGWARKNQARLMPRSMRRVIEICQVENAQVAKPARTGPPPRQDSADGYAAVDLHGYLTAHHECGQKIVALLANGTVSPCLLLRESEHRIGDLHVDSMTAIADGSADRHRFDNSMRLDAIPGCQDCEARYVCKAGGCPASAYALTGFVARKNPMYDKCYYDAARGIESTPTGSCV